MTSVWIKEGPESGDVPPHVSRGTTREHREQCVVVDVRVWHDRKFYGFKEHVERDRWESASAAERRQMIAVVASGLIRFLEEES
jgi:hypothetical protein